MPTMSRRELERIEATKNLRRKWGRIAAAVVLLGWFAASILKGCQ